jgi:hypothetical protein
MPERQSEGKGSGRLAGERRSEEEERIPYLTLGKVTVPYLALENFFFSI